MMGNRRRTTAIGLMLGLAAAPLAAQQRQGLPMAAPLRADLPAVEQAAPPVDPDREGRALVARFAGWNRAHGRPRLLVLWDRHLDDETITRYQDRSQGATVRTALPGAAVTAYDRTERQERLTGGADHGIGAGDSRDLETAFISAFVGAGANLAERAALMRKVSLTQAHEGRSDQQFMESLALEQGVAYLIEVSPSYGPSGSGYGFAVKLTHLPTSRIVAGFQTTAQPGEGPESFVATRGGFRRERPDRNTPGLIGGTLAAEVMSRFP